MKGFSFTDYKTRTIEVEMEGQIYILNLQYRNKYIELKSVWKTTEDEGLVRWGTPVEFKYKPISDHSWSNILWYVKQDLRYFLKNLFGYFKTLFS